MRFNFVRKTLRTIRNLFRGNKMSYEFRNVEVKQIEDKIKLKESATNDGKNNLFDFIFFINILCKQFMGS